MFDERQQQRSLCLLQVHLTSGSPLKAEPTIGLSLDTWLWCLIFVCLWGCWRCGAHHVGLRKEPKALDGDLERWHTNVPRKYMITRDAVKPFMQTGLLNSHSIRYLNCCSHCDPTDVQTKRDWRRRIGIREPVLNLGVLPMSYSGLVGCCSAFVGEPDSQDLYTDPPQRRITLDDPTCALTIQFWARRLRQSTVRVSFIWILTCLL